MKNSYKQFIIIFVALATASSASGAVLVSEIAWMGTSESSNAEWVEIQNTNAEEVVVDGWTLSSSDGSPSISLSGNIPGGGFLIIERTSDDSLPGVTADVIYSGALGNSGEDFVLTDDSGAEIDTLPFGSGWPAGDNDTKETMQRTESSWITGPPSPRSSTLTIEEKTTEEDAGLDTSTTTAPTNPNTSTSRTPEIEGEVIIPESILVGRLFEIKTNLTNHNQFLPYSEIEINLGDGSHQRQKISEPLYHRFLFPGKYTIRYEVKSQPWRTQAEISGEWSIEVFSPNFFIHHEENVLILENKSASSVDISNWKLIDQEGQAIFLPPMTSLPKDEKIILSNPGILKNLGAFNPIQLVDEYGIQYPLLGNAPEPEKDKKTPVDVTSAPSKQLQQTAPDTHPKETIDTTSQGTTGPLLAASVASAPLLSKTTTSSWPWFALAILILLNLFLFGFLAKRHRLTEEQSEQMDLFR